MPGPCDCRHCTTPAATVAERAPEPTVLPDRPTLIRVHSAGRPPFDCTLHPDGSLTAVMGGEVRRNFLTFADMREQGWAHARIEFDPQPLAEESEPPPAAAIVQEAIAL